MTRLGVPKGGFRLMEAWEDWYVLEGGTNWAQVEGDASEWRAIAAGIRSGQTVRFKRCAVSVGETHIGLESPRNSRGDDDLVLIEKRLGEDLVAHILAVVGPGPEPEPARPPLPPVAPGAPERADVRKALDTRWALLLRCRALIGALQGAECEGRLASGHYTLRGFHLGDVAALLVAIDVEGETADPLTGERP